VASDAAVKNSESAQTQLEAQSKQLEAQAKRLDAQTQRARALHNALTATFGMVDTDTADQMRKDRIIGGALDQ
jgi:multidrug resistance efflux pump